MSQEAFAYAADIRPAFLAHMANRLDRIICKQTKDLLDEAALIAPITCLSIIVFLKKHGSGTIADIAKVDGQSHQLIQSRTNPLEKLGLIESTIDAIDSRCRILRLTKQGNREAVKIEEISRQVAGDLVAMNSVLGADLMSLLEKAEQYLIRNPLSIAGGV
ncbi:MAG: MarR family winged helix-turn-helix transcriptional regulator [Parasphingorhabdus sp.]